MATVAVDGHCCCRWPLLLQVPQMHGVACACSKFPASCHGAARQLVHWYTGCYASAIKIHLSQGQTSGTGSAQAAPKLSKALLSCVKEVCVYSLAYISSAATDLTGQGIHPKEIHSSNCCIKFATVINSLANFSSEAHVNNNILCDAGWLCQTSTAPSPSLICWGTCYLG